MNILGHILNNHEFKLLKNKATFSTRSKDMHLDGAIKDFGRENILSSIYEKPYLEDPFMKEFGNISNFDLRDPFLW